LRWPSFIFNCLDVLFDARLPLVKKHHFGAL
jgi:hypothetical protein